ncbi:hypothetical protein Tsubulata_019611 [Turnera subulata]|uniref:GS catalytic domain-containing protein n=1 Tax=Turnera subulata TaxID=218843 RepID=A0A9Q0J488_9ROSI|nr:hypothetical protein Tsubulata_019611 [Turnera subulata]
MKHEEIVLADMHIRPGEAWEYCPREALRRVLKVLKDEFDLVLDTGFESEFLLLKSVASYDRLQPNTWSGAYLCWGKENREAPIRTACQPGTNDGSLSNFEIKSFDACANPYLALASIIAAGIDGLRRNLRLPEPVDINPSMDANLQTLPQSLSESLEALEKDKALTDLLGEELLVAIKGVRKVEIDHYSNNKDAYKKLIHLY